MDIVLVNPIKRVQDFMTFFRKIKRFASNQITNDLAFDPSLLNDDVAMKAAWTPLSNIDASFCTHDFQQKSPTRIEFKLRFQVFVFFGFIITLSLGFIIVPLLICPDFQGDKLGFLVATGFVLGGIFFSITGLIGLLIAKKTPIFDKSVGYFWKERCRSFVTPRFGTSRKYCKLDRIYAIQLLYKKCEGYDSESHFHYSYELNLVLDDGQRLNVIDHAEICQIRAEAAILAEFLDVPIWDIVPEPAIIKA